MPVFDAMFPFARRSEYFLLFGRRGLAEYQALVPHDAIEGFLRDLEREALRRRPPLVMLSMKLFRGTQRLLRFEADGVCFTADLVRSRAGLRFLQVLDQLTVAAGGLPHIIKDSRLPVGVVRECYPEYERSENNCVCTTLSGAGRLSEGWSVTDLIVGASAGLGEPSPFAWRRRQIVPCLRPARRRRGVGPLIRHGVRSSLSPRTSVARASTSSCSKLARWGPKRCSSHGRAVAPTTTRMSMSPPQPSHR
jgi:hypothetical protein